MNHYSTSLELRIDWSEIDLFGHVNNLAILKYVQSARVNYMEVIGLMQMQAEMKIGPILASTNCQFRKPLFYPGKITVHSKITAIKTTSFIMQHAIYDEQRQLVAEAEDVIVFFDFIHNTKLNIPNEVRKKIEVVENGVSKEALINPILCEQICGIKHFAKQKIVTYSINQCFPK